MRTIIENIAFWLGLILAIIAVVDFIWNNLISPKRRQRKFIRKRLIVYLVAVVVILLLGSLINIYIKSNLHAGDTYIDKFLSMRITNKIKGPFYNCERYDLSLELTNNRSVMLIMPEIEFSFFNTNVEKLVSMPPNQNGSFFKGIHKNPGGGILLPNEKKIITITGPQFMPKSVEIHVIHSGTDNGTISKFILSDDNDVEYWTSPKHVYIEKEQSSIDGLDAYKKSTKIAKKLLGNAELAFCVAMKHTMRKQNNGINVYEIPVWSLLFVKPNTDKGAWITVDDKEPRGSVITMEEHPEYKNLMMRSSDKPILVGTFEALKLVGQLNLIYGNSCQGWWLEPDGLVKGEKRPIWKLPYVGKNYMPLYIDAFTGDILDLDAEYQQKNNGPPWKFNIILEKSQQDQSDTTDNQQQTKESDIGSFEDADQQVNVTELSSVKNFPQFSIEFRKNILTILELIATDDKDNNKLLQEIYVLGDAAGSVLLSIAVDNKVEAIVRVWSIIILPKTTNIQGEISETLSTLLDDGSFVVRANVALQLVENVNLSILENKIPGIQEKIAKALVEGMKITKGAWFSDNCSRALIRMGDNSFLVVLVALLEQKKGEYDPLLTNTLINLGQYPIPYLVTAFEISDPVAIANASTALVQYGKLAIPNLVKELKETKNNWKKIIVISILGKMGKDASSILPTIKSFINSSDPKLRSAAKQAAENITSGSFSDEEIRRIVKDFHLAPLSSLFGVKKNYRKKGKSTKEITMLMRAVVKRDKINTNLIISQGVDINLTYYETGWTCLVTAIINEYPEIVKVLLDNNADVFIMDKNKMIASEHAKSTGNQEIIKMVDAAEKKQIAKMKANAKSIN